MLNKSFRIRQLSLTALVFLSGLSAHADGQASAPQQPSMFGMITPFIVMFGIMYLLVIRPQQKKTREQQELLSTLKQGDEVVTQSGILGTIYGITEKVVTLEVDKNVHVRVLRSQVAQIVKGSI